MEEGGKKNIQKTTSCFYKVMSQLFAIHQLTNAGKSRLIGKLREWGEGLQCKGFSHDKEIVSAVTENLSQSFWLTFPALVSQLLC